MRQLRELAEAYAAGELPQSSYRARRARILDDLVGLSSLSRETTRPRSAIHSADDATAPRPIRPESSPAAAGESHRVTSTLLVGFVLLCVVGTLWWTQWPPWVPWPERPPLPRWAQSNEAYESNDAVAAEAMVGDFLGRDDWSDEAISQFNGLWWRLSDEQIADRLAAPSTQALRAAVAARLQQRAVESVAGAAPLDASAPLVLLAKNLNVPVPPGAIDRNDESEAVPSSGAEPTPSGAQHASPTSP
jgi:hypothetical protein